MNLYEIAVWPVGHNLARIFRNQTEDVVKQVAKAFDKGRAFALSDPDDPYTIMCFGRGQVTHIQYKQTGGTE